MATAAPTFVIGHKTPDAGFNLFSVIAYAAFKEARGEMPPPHVAVTPMRASTRSPNVSTRALPLYLSDVLPRVHDMMTPSPYAVTDDATCAEAR